jgi:protocatechuate 3,4-dioxygenase beta subunit
MNPAPPETARRRCYYLQYMAVSRRRFVGLSLAGIPAMWSRGSAAQGLEQFAIAEPPCTDDPRVTPSVPRDSTFRAGAPLRSNLVEPGMAGEVFNFSATVTGITCGRIAGARVDLWQPDAKGIYDASGFRLRGHQVTSAKGGVTFNTIIPGAPAQRAKHLSLRVQVSGKLDFSTELFFPNDAAAPNDKRFRKELLLKFTKLTAGQSAIFDVVLPL